MSPEQTPPSAEQPTPPVAEVPAPITVTFAGDVHAIPVVQLADPDGRTTVSPSDAALNAVWTSAVESDAALIVAAIETARKQK